MDVVPKLPHSKGVFFCVVEHGFGATCFSNLSNFKLTSQIEKVAPHTLSIHISPRPNSFRPLPFSFKSSWVVRSCQIMPLARRYFDFAWSTSLPFLIFLARVFGGSTWFASHFAMLYELQVLAETLIHLQHFISAWWLLL